MTGQLQIHSAGPGVTIQDQGRPGWTAEGLSRGGAADPLALLEAAVLLGSDPANAGIEMMGMGGVFSTTQNTRFALTGARMQATVDGAPVAPNSSHLLRAGQKLRIGGAQSGVFGYLAFAGGITTDPVMGSRATHLTAGIGRVLQAGDERPLGTDKDLLAGPMRLPASDRLAGGVIRIMPGPQTDFFDADTLARFTQATFKRSPRGNRQGVRLDHDGAGFDAAGQLNIVSDVIVPGDIQMTGDGVPYVLLAECQTIGGYPRIGTVIPADLPRIAQAMPGATLQFQMLDVTTADATVQPARTQLATLRKACQPLVRDPHDIADLLGYQLISGVTPGDDLERP
ncbi:biotin-dependent carboxyltransferase family protein [Yoonia sp.]|uniref:5-oxoprolinase subunit C family protein n=1 Tax=Yoonia sp. TaxID=2212373 RepID=UPI0019FC7A14|nr:biotin-dependent carboxyltransferase family protein [Yoonia sp.]MBE0412298.1 biotin-dependent carboxyltransferase [Yoonia sp.]